MLPTVTLFLRTLLTLPAPTFDYVASWKLSTYYYKVFTELTAFEFVPS